MSQLMLVNPKRRTKRKTAKANPKRRRKTTRRRSTKRAAPRRRVTRRRARRNPKFSLRSIQRDAIMPAAIGGVGALGLDLAFAFLPIPANFKTGIIGSVAKLAGAVVLGNVVGNLAGKKTGEAFTLGAVTIQAYGLVKNLVQNAAPGLPLSGDPMLQYYTPGMGYVSAGSQVPYGSGISDYNAAPGMGEYIPDGHASQYEGESMGEYINGY